MKLDDIRRTHAGRKEPAPTPQCLCGNHLLHRDQHGHDNWFCDKCDKAWHSGPGEANGHPGTLKTLPECPKCEGTDPARDQGMPPITMAERDGPYKAMSDGSGASCPKCAKTDTKRFYNGGRFQKWSCERCASRWTVIREGPSANRVVDAPLELDEKGFLEAFKPDTSKSGAVVSTYTTTDATGRS